MSTLLCISKLAVSLDDIVALYCRAYNTFTAIEFSSTVTYSGEGDKRSVKKQNYIAH